MEREYSRDKPPGILTEHLGRNRDFHVFRRRAVLTTSNNKWCLVCCAVEAFESEDDLPPPSDSHRYTQTILYEDFLTGGECLEFANQLQGGHIQFGDICPDPAENPNWSVEFVPLTNNHMTRAGHVVELAFSTRANWSSGSALLNPTEPYYPNLDEAARAWLPFPVYHGHSDGRNNRILFLLPQTVAFIANAVTSHNGALEVEVRGTGAASLPLLVKGAYWEGPRLHQIQADVMQGRASLAVPEGIDWFEYHLIGEDGTHYDFQREDQFGHTGLGRQRLSPEKMNLVEQVRAACDGGEGLNVEFKPFVSPGEQMAERRKTKLRELITTVVAFANTKGGRIYLGVEDDCGLAGIDQGFRKWAESDVGKKPLARYLGALKSRIKDLVHGEITATVNCIELDGVHVAIVEVPQAANKPVRIVDDNHLYIRTGANNRKAPPELWRSILEPSSRDWE